MSQYALKGRFANKKVGDTSADTGSGGYWPAMPQKVEAKQRYEVDLECELVSAEYKEDGRKIEMVDPKTKAKKEKVLPTLLHTYRICDGQEDILGADAGGKEVKGKAFSDFFDEEDYEGTDKEWMIDKIDKEARRLRAFLDLSLGEETAATLDWGSGIGNHIDLVNKCAEEGNPVKAIVRFTIYGHAIEKDSADGESKVPDIIPLRAEYIHDVVVAEPNPIADDSQAVVQDTPPAETATA